MRRLALMNRVPLEIQENERSHIRGHGRHNELRHHLHPDRDTIPVVTPPASWTIAHGCCSTPGHGTP
jgi:hypothetical protein